jgi:hypothetical protein
MEVYPTDGPRLVVDQGSVGLKSYMDAFRGKSWGQFIGKLGAKIIASSELRRWWGVQGTLAAIQELECGEQLWIALFSHQKPSGSSHARHGER